MPANSRVYGAERSEVKPLAVICNLCSEHLRVGERHDCKELPAASGKVGELAALRARHARAVELLREVHMSGRDERHPVIHYQEVQIDCITLEEIAAFLASETTP
jgi:hypothetical protein